MENGLTEIYYGDGKGKTTSALGTALRALGSDYKVHLIQFMKNGSGNPEIDNPGELISLVSLPNFTFRRFGLGSWYIKGRNDEEHRENIMAAFNYLKEALNDKNYDVVIADEILYAVQLGLLAESDVIDLIKNKPKNKELILTGSHHPFPNIFQHADLVTEVKKVKHPYDQGIKARKGIEY